MVDIFYLSNDKHVDINVIDSVENIAGQYPDFYEKFKFRFYTLDFNAPEPFISDPWMLFAVYNDTNKYVCNYTAVPHKKFISLNWNSKSHRRKVLAMMPHLDAYYSDLSDEQNLTEIPQFYPNGYYKDRFDYGVPKEYFHALIDVVTESYVGTASHFSEKSYKPLYYKKPFITVAGPNYYATMVKYGFVLYDELFDYDFDRIDSIEERIDEILFQLADLNKKSIDELSAMVDWEKVEYNHQQLYKVKSEYYDNKLQSREFSI